MEGGGNKRGEGVVGRTGKDRGGVMWGGEGRKGVREGRRDPRRRRKSGGEVQSIPASSIRISF